MIEIVGRHAPNVPGAILGCHIISPGDLARFSPNQGPGDPYGGPTAQIADYIESVLLPQCDFVFDFHSGGSSLYTKLTLMPRRARMKRGM